MRFYYLALNIYPSELPWQSKLVAMRSPEDLKCLIKEVANNVEAIRIPVDIMLAKEHTTGLCLLVAIPQDRSNLGSVAKALCGQIVHAIYLDGLRKYFSCRGIVLGAYHPTEPSSINICAFWNKDTDKPQQIHSEFRY